MRRFSIEQQYNFILYNKSKPNLYRSTDVGEISEHSRFGRYISAWNIREHSTEQVYVEYHPFDILLNRC